MYKKSISDNSKYLIPFIEGIKYYKKEEIEHNLGTMMILNSNGDVLTCKHIATQFIANLELADNYKKIMNEMDKAKNEQERKNIEKKYNLTDDSMVLSNINLPFKLTGNVEINIKAHKNLDIAIISFKGIKFNIDTFPTFSKTLPEQGQSVCKLGFAFPEYDFFEYSKEKRNIIMKKNIVANFPLFPLDGIVTRHIMDENNKLSMFEMSTPGIVGQSGGPIFSPEGLVYGMQSMTKYMKLPLNLINNDGSFDINPYLSLGVGVSSVEIIKFLEENKIKFNKK